MESIPDSAVGFVLGCLKEVVLHYRDLICNSEDKVNDLCRHLNFLKAFIDEYTEKSKYMKKNKVIEAMVEDVKTEVFSSENAIESYIVTTTLQRERGVLSKVFHTMGYASELQGVADSIIQISGRVDKFKNDLAWRSIENMRYDMKEEEPQKREAPPVDDNMVGLRDEVDKVVKLLEKESEGLEVIVLVGPPGLGKTTLARHVNNHHQIKPLFATNRLFIRVSQEFNKNELLRDLLRALNPNHEKVNDDDLKDSNIVHAIVEELNKGAEPYMIVLDDVWTKEAWNQLKGAFPSKKNSKVLITSRHEEVAHHASSSRSPITLRPLNYEESYELLMRRVFGHDEKPHLTSVKNYAEMILKKCGGLPLSILVVAGTLLGHQTNTNKWRIVAKDLNHYLAENEEMNDLIRLSYNDLPPHLKMCFLYLGVFAQDSTIPVWKLLRLWVAEGFVYLEDIGSNLRLEDKAEEYLEDLVARNLVVVDEKRGNGQIKTCRLLDVIREFCKTEAKTQSIFHEIQLGGEANNSSVNTRRLCINSYVQQYMLKPRPNECVRSLLSFSNEEDTKVPIDFVPSFPKGYKLLRVLDARAITFTDFPDELLTLVLLRYIGISCDSNTIPKGMSKLRCLQTLIIGKCKAPLLELEADIWEMPQLRHLHTDVPARLHDSGKGETFRPNLQTLTSISPESCKPELLARTPKMKKLGICGHLPSTLFDSLSSLENLENLKLFHQSSSGQPFVVLQSKGFPKGLTKLTLQNTLLNWKYMYILANLENLQALKLKENAFVGKRWDEMEKPFDCLEVLHIGKTDLEEWETNQESFPGLRCLILTKCRKLKGIPQGIGLIESLQTIKLFDTTKHVAASAWDIQVLKARLMKDFELFVHNATTDSSEYSQSEPTRDDEQRVEEMSQVNEASRGATWDGSKQENPKQSSKCSFFKNIFHKSSKESNEKTSKIKRKWF